MDDQRDSARIIWNQIKEHLEIKRKQLADQINKYPTPIAACDQQFNFLLQQRADFATEWARLLETEKTSSRESDPIDALREFVNSSSQLDDAFKFALQQKLLDA